MVFASPYSWIAVAAILVAIAYTFLRKALFTFTVSLAILVVFALQIIDGRVTEDLAISRLPLGWSGPWTWVTFQFVHGGLAHILLNLMALLFITPVFEERVGALRVAVLFFVGGAIGAAGFVALNASGFFVLVGASAGISAVFGAYGRLYPRDRVQLFLPLPGLPAIPVIELVLGFLILETVLSFTGFLLPGFGNVAWQAHVVAMIFGLAAAPLVMRLPAGARRPTRLMPIEALRALATTPDLRSILEEAEAVDIPELRAAWVEKFVQKARCPRCGGPIRLRFGRLSSPCGWHERIG